MLRTILTFLQVVSAVGIVGLVLLQRGKGADAGAGFGAGASGTVFGARGASTGLSPQGLSENVLCPFVLTSQICAHGVGTAAGGADALG